MPKVDLSPLYVDEAQHIQTLKFLGNNIVSTGQKIWTSASSGISYNTADHSTDPTIFNQGDKGIMNLLIKTYGGANGFLVEASDLNTLTTGISDLNTNKQEKINVNGILKGDGLGVVVSASPGVDYLIPGSITQNTNLLINSDFRNPVNQRGKSTFNDVYGIDRWICYNATATVIAGGLSLAQNAVLTQYLDTPIKSLIAGSNVCITINAGVNDLIFKGIVNTTGSTIIEDNDAFKISFADGGKGLQILAKSTMNIKYIKLELGNTPTPFVPRIYDQEFLLCQRYYQKMFAYRSSGYRYAETFGDKRCKIFSPTTVEMRTNPTVKLISGKTLANCILVAGYKALTPTNFAYGSTPTGISFIFTVPDSELNVDTLGVILNQDDDPFEADAEIY